MPEHPTHVVRPAIGFVVEGDGEYHCYPSLVTRIIGEHIHTPIANARGCAGIVCRLSEHLRSLVLAYHPFHIIATVDLLDLLGQGHFADCRSAREGLQAAAEAWLATAPEDSRMLPVPEEIKLILQVTQFESWFVADAEGLVESGVLSSVPGSFQNVDEEIASPSAWLAQRLGPGRHLKNPRFAKQVVSHLSPEIMRSRSRSFDKFYREVRLSYSAWRQACEAEWERTAP